MNWAADKILHYNVGYDLGRKFTVLASIAAGAYKEIILDWLLSKGTPELNDFKATVIGGWDGMWRKENRFITK